MNRDIFEYHNGVSKVFGDPLALWRKFFVQCEGVPQEWLQATQDEAQPLRAAVYAEKVLDAARKAFNLIGFDTSTGKGVTDNDAFGVIESFFDFLDQKKTARETSPTSTPPMAA